MHEAISAARKSIYWEIYIFVDDEAGSRFVDALVDKAKAGVDVKIVMDAMGSWGLSRLAEARLKGAGAAVLYYNRLHPELALGKWLGRLWRRNHRKLLIVDEEIAFIGGVNVESKALAWNDLFLKLTGPVIYPLLRSFAKTYIRAGGKKDDVRHLQRPALPQELKSWQEKIRFIIHSPLDRPLSPLRKMYHRGLAMAKESVNLLTPYVVPDRAWLRLLAEARRRGVKVNLFLPERSDHLVMEWIARAYHGILHRAGVNVYLFSKMHHGKAMTVDSKVGYVGSSNLTPRSWLINEEAGVYFNDEQMANELNRFFEEWKKEATPLDLERWKKRGWRAKFKEWWAKKIEKFV